ncbi:MAG: hypothetical protein WCA46_20170 [Actinocatenispora sp.]
MTVTPAEDAAGEPAAGGGAGGGGGHGPEGTAADRQPFLMTPNAEKYLIEADSLRRRQLRSSLLHGSTRTWRDRRRIWPAVLTGVIVVAMIVAAIAVAGAFHRQAENERRQQQEQERQQQQLRPSPLPSVRSGH